MIERQIKSTHKNNWITVINRSHVFSTLLVRNFPVDLHSLGYLTDHRCGQSSGGQWLLRQSTRSQLHLCGDWMDVGHYSLLSRGVYSTIPSLSTASDSTGDRGRW